MAPEKIVLYMKNIEREDLWNEYPGKSRLTRPDFLGVLYLFTFFEKKILK